MVSCMSFEDVAAALEPLGARRAKMMGRPMLALGSKMFACLDNGKLACRLGRDTPEFAEALAVPGAVLFSPGASNRIFKDWVSLPDSRVDDWERFAVAALAHTASTNG